MAQHFITKCTCGTILAQCRCPSRDKAVTIIDRGCGTCHGSTASVVRDGQVWTIGDGKAFVTLTQEDWKFVNGTIHEHYHGED